MKQKRTKQERSRSAKANQGAALADARPKHLGFAIRSWWQQLLLLALSLILQLIIFAPADIWPAAYICLVPWLVLIGASESARRVYFLSYILGVAFFAISMRWLFVVTIEGASLLFVVLGFFYPLAACAVRHSIRRRWFPLSIAFPVIWVGCEAVRSIGVPQFPWNLLGHSHHSVLTFIQISDLVGAYAVSFVIASINGMLADLLFFRIGRPRESMFDKGKASLWPSVVFAGGLVAFTIVYGIWQMNRNTTTEGPKIAVIQGNYPNYVDIETAGRQPTPRDRADRYAELLSQALADEPDLFLLPETPWTMHLNRPVVDYDNIWAYSSKECYEFLQETAKRAEAYLVTGCLSIEPTPLDLLADRRLYNSSYVFSPEGGEPGRYDKNVLVLIGEYVPFRYGPLRFVYLWVNAHLPFGSEDYEFSLTPGKGFNTFKMKARTQQGKEYTFGTPICYENAMPHVSRAFVNSKDGKESDFLLNMSNDGWFIHSTELPQHLAASVFRAVENRVGVARAVNTGISCFIDVDGRVHDMVTDENGRAVGPGIDGYRVARVQVDSRYTFYSRYGDWFAVACAILWGLITLDYVAARLLAGHAQRQKARTQ